MCFEAGRPLPDAIENEPQLMPGLNIYLEAYIALCPWRRDGYIPLDALVTWCELYAIDPALLEDMLLHIPALDAAHRKHDHEVAERGRKRTEAQHRRKRGR